MAEDKENKVNHMIKLIVSDEMFEDFAKLSDYKEKPIEDLIYEMLDDSIAQGYRDVLSDIAWAQIEKREAEEVQNRRRAFKVVSDKEKE